MHPKLVPAATIISSKNGKFAFVSLLQNPIPQTRIELSAFCLPRKHFTDEDMQIEKGIPHVNIPCCVNHYGNDTQPQLGFRYWISPVVCVPVEANN